MKLTWKGEKLGEITTPTIKEMRVVKRDLGIRNPITFLNRAIMLQVEVPLIGTDGKPVKDEKTGKILTQDQPNEDFDMDCLAMLIALMMTRLGRPTDFEDIDGDISKDFEIDMTEEEKAQLAEEAKLAKEGKAPALPAPPALSTSPDSTSTTSTIEFFDTPPDSGSTTA